VLSLALANARIIPSKSIAEIFLHGFVDTVPLFTAQRRPGTCGFENLSAQLESPLAVSL